MVRLMRSFRPDGGGRLLAALRLAEALEEVAALRAEVARLEAVRMELVVENNAEVARVRRETIEECARMVDRERLKTSHGGEGYWVHLALRRLERGIRALAPEAPA